MQHEQDRMPEQDRIPPELDPSYARFDDEQPSRTLANRMRPIIWLAAVVALAAMVVVFVL